MKQGIVFIAWSKLSRRSRDLARELGANLIFFADKPPYLSTFEKTRRFLEREKPDVVFVQLPQGPLLWLALRLSKRLGFRIVADVHTGFVYITSFKGFVLNKPFNHMLKDADLVIAHNPLQRSYIIEKLGLVEEKTIVVYDPIPKYIKDVDKQVEGLDPGKYIVFPASWASDEPIDFIVKEFLSSEISEEFKLVITNDFRRNMRLYRRVENTLKKFSSLDKVVISGYLEEPQYRWVIEHSRAVIAATNREYTMLSAIWEAVGFRKPFIASKTNAIKSIVGEYPCLFQLAEGSLRKVLEKCFNEIDVESIAKPVISKLERLSQESIENLKNLLKAMISDSSTSYNKE
ncbi:MAG: glycosyltransferase [Ignisphaera sp.]